MTDPSGSEAVSGSSRQQAHPAVRTTLRIALTAEEYETLHRHLVQRTPPKVHSKALHPDDYRKIVNPSYENGDTALRDSLRVFLASSLAVKLLEKITRRLKRGSLESFPALRLASALSVALLLQRSIRRFLVRLRANLRSDDARSFCERNPNVAKILTSRYTSAVGSSLAGFALGILPEGAVRSYVALWLFVRAIEATYNAAEAKGYLFKERPWWFGSWLLMPVSMAQLFHAFMLDRDTAPGWFNSILLNYAPAYVQQKPDGLSPERQWPAPTEIVDSLARLAKLNWPAFTSPILHPSHPQPLPNGIEQMAPITSPAHPSISSLSCALLHPKSTSCLNVAVQQNLLTIPRLGNMLMKVHLVLSLLKLKGLLRHPLKTTNGLCVDVVSRTALLSAVISAAWGSICLFNNYLPRRFLPTQRFYLSGALAGLPFAALGQDHRGLFLYFFRIAIGSFWESGKRRKVFRAVKNGDLFIISAFWAVLCILLNGRPKTVSGASFRKVLTWCQGNGFVDPVVVSKERAKKRKESIEEKN
ncbi:hypothetical protein KEM56_003268 [Ascosphaera pollenicola]|nr:hypothetical protein KEM56_003268 [Ascosphaera pollenicola]